MQKVYANIPFQCNTQDVVSHDHDSDIYLMNMTFG